MTPPDLMVQVPASVLRSLAPLAAEAGIDLPESDRLVPMVDMGRPVREIAMELGRLLTRAPIFLRAETVVTVDQASGDVRMMEREAFVSWVEDYVTMIKMRQAQGGAEPRAESMSKDLAAKLIHSPQFRRLLRPLKEVHQVRMPVLREGGTVELLPSGYDDQSEIYTVETVRFVLDWSREKAELYLSELLSEFPWSDLEVDSAVSQCRAASVTFAAMLGGFLRGMFAPGTPRPGIAFLSNQPGTGKSTLAAATHAGPFGVVGNTDLPTSGEEMIKTLAAEAQSFSPVVWFDDIGKAISSPQLNRFITSSQHRGRVLGSKENFSVPNVSQVVVTGNDLRWTADLQRRFLQASLFLAGDVRGRKFRKTITPRWLAQDSVRAEILAALWAVVRNWIDAGMPRHARPMETFEEWSSLVGGCVQAFGWADPLATPEVDGSGDVEGEEWRQLFGALAMEQAAGQAREWSRAEVVGTARSMGVLEDIMGADGDGDLRTQENKRLGYKLRKWRGREFTDPAGRRYVVGSRRSHGVRSLLITLL